MNPSSPVKLIQNTITFKYVWNMKMGTSIKYYVDCTCKAKHNTEV